MIASGSGVVPASNSAWARSSSVGSRSASALKAGSRRVVGQTASSAARKPGRVRRPRVDHPRQHVAGQRPARLPPVEGVGVVGEQERALGRRRRRGRGSPAPRSRAGATATGRAGSPSKRKLWVRSVSSSTSSAAPRRPSRVEQPEAIGITSGALLGLARRRRRLLAEGQRCRRPSPVLADASAAACRPAEYQSLNCVRSRPVASSKTFSQSSMVQASPSWRSK